MSPAWRTVLVEDEPEARENLRAYARDVPWLTLVGEAADGAEAVRVIDDLRPDLVFLDVTLPACSGLQVLERIAHRPEVVFTTAHDRFALAAFEVGALAYLLKPFGRQRFLDTLSRLQRRPSPPAPERLADAMKSPLRRLFARTRDGIVPLPVASIRHLRAAGDYVEVYTEGAVHLVHVGLAELAARLDGEQFRQVHRAHVVNMDAVLHIRPFDERRLVIELRDGTRIVASRAASEELRRLAR